MKISEVMKETGLTKKAIYHYEEVDLIRPKKEEENNYRIYSTDDIKRLITINALRKLDFAIKDIQLVLSVKEDFTQAILEFRKFTTDNLIPIFKEVEKYVSILSSRFEKFNKIQCVSTGYGK